MQKPKSKQSIAEKAENSNKAKALRQYVQGALASSSKAKGGSTAYTNFVRELQSLRRKLENGQHDAAAEFSLVCLVQALISCASSLKEGIHDAVLTTILSIGLWSCTKPVRGAVLDLTVELVVVSSTFIPNCMQVLIFNLLPPPGSPPLQPDIAGEAWTPPPLATEVQEQVVDAIEKAIQLVPALPTRLLPMLVQNIPHKLRDRNTQCLYMRALLLLAEGKIGSSMREGMLLGIVEHLLGIDADIKWQEIVDVPSAYDREECSSDEEQDDIFELEGMSELDINGHHTLHLQQHEQQLAALQDGFHDPSAFVAASQQSLGLRRLQQQLAAAATNGGAANGAAKRPAVDETADKLDSLMEMVFQHLQWRVNAGQLGAAWQTMIMAFERTLLHAHRCKFTQYLVFFLALKDPQRCCNSFVACLMSLLRDSRQPPITRSACSAYLSSFLARCALAPKELVVDVMVKLAAVCEEYAGNVLQQQQEQGLSGRRSSSSSVLLLQGSGSGGGGSSSSSNALLGAVQRHQAFYAMVQGLLYLLCYHMQPLLGVQQQQQQQPLEQQQQQPDQQQQQLAEAVSQLVQQRVLPLMSHPLAPLAVCNQLVVVEFVRQVVLLGFADESWDQAASNAVAAHRAAVASATAAAAAVVVGGDAAEDGSSAANGVLRPLEAFYPFDPYLLYRSKRFLELDRSYISFCRGHPHVLGAVEAVEAAAAGAVGGSSDECSESGSENGSEGENAGDEQALLQRAAAAAAAGASPQGHRGHLGMRDDEDGSDDSSSTSSENEADAAAAAAGEAAGKAAAAAARGGGAAPAGGISRSGSRAGNRRPGVVPVGLAAAAVVGGGPGALSGPSPPADMMATSLVTVPYLGGVSYSPGEAAMADQMGGSPYGLSPGMAMPMSYTYEGQYMQNLPARS